MTDTHLMILISLILLKIYAYKHLYIEPWINVWWALNQIKHPEFTFERRNSQELLGMVLRRNLQLKVSSTTFILIFSFYSEFKSQIVLEKLEYVFYWKSWNFRLSFDGFNVTTVERALDQCCWLHIELQVSAVCP